jgi:hypothetical protein
LRGYESAFGRTRYEFVDLGSNLVQVAFQSLCVLKLAVGFRFFDEGLQESFLLQQRLKGMCELGVGIDDRAIGRCTL